MKTKKVKVDTKDLSTELPDIPKSPSTYSDFMQETEDLINNTDYSADEYNQAIKIIQSITDQDELPWKVQRFCSEYVVHYDGQKSAIKAGWPEWNANTFAKRLLAHPRVRAEIERLQKNVATKLQITQERVLEEIAHMAYGNVANFYDEEGILIPVHKLEKHISASIQDMVYDRGGRLLGYKLAAKSVALDALSKTLGIFDKGSDRTLPVDLKQFISMLPQELQDTIRVGFARRVGNKK